MEDAEDEDAKQPSAKKHKISDLEIFNLLQHPVFLFDTERCCMLWANESALEVWNAESLPELLARNFQGGLSETARRRLQDTEDRITRGETHRDTWTLYPKGKAKQVAIVATGMRLQDGRIAALVEVELLNNTQFEKASTKCTEVLRYLPLAVCQFDDAGKLEYQNPEAMGIFGTKREPTETPDFVALFVNQELGNKVLEKVKAEGDHSLEAQQYTSGNIPKYFHVSIRRAIDPITSEPNILYSAREITEVIEAREEARKVRIKSDLIAVVSHQIRTPLHHVVGHLDLIESSGLSVDQLESVKEMQRSCSLLMTVTNDLSDYAKLESGTMQLEKKAFCPKAVLETCLSTIAKPAKQKGLEVIESTVGLPAELVGDADRLRQVLLNLLDNALKFTEKGSISLKATGTTASTGQTRLRFEVADTGIGIHQQHHERIFKEYEQGSVDSAIKYGGTGLGLSLSKSLTEAMGGDITVQSEVGEGTAFTLEIPFNATIAPAAAAAATLKPSAIAELRTVDSDRRKNRILIVEDNLVNQKMLAKMLQRMGHEAVVAPDGKVAVDLVSKSSAFDLILMDVCMPVLDGIDATKQIREMGFSKSALPIIGVTASFQISELGYYQEIGMNHCIGKPATMSTLKQVIESYGGGA